MRDAKGRFVNNHEVPIEWRLSLSKLFKERGYKPKVIYRKTGKEHHAWKNKIKKICVVCGREFEVHPYRANTAKYCSLRCLYNRKKQKRRCLFCGKEFYTLVNQKYCSRKCMGLDKRREKHPNWKGGISINRLRFYDSIEWEEIKKKILKRDNYLCQFCGSHKKLEVHHILPFSLFPELRLTEWNLITVCQTCHKKLTKNFHPNKWVIIYEN
jgi:5-methylcytosine-specific restriction endonuclease McrA